MTSRKAIAEAYFEGFRESDHPKILTLLTDDVVWDIVGVKVLAGKEAFDGEIENDAFEGNPVLEVTRFVEEDDTVVALGEGAGKMKTGEAFHFAFCTVLHFTGARISRVTSYIVPLGTPAAPLS